MSGDAAVLRELAKRVMEAARLPIQDERREAWRQSNSLRRVQPLIYVRAFAFHEVLEPGALRCEDPFFRGIELRLRELLFRARIPDDFIIEPWITVPAVYVPSAENRWGVPVSLGEKTAPQGAAAYRPVLHDEADFEKLIFPTHGIDEAATRALREKLQEALGDVMPVHVTRGSIFGMWNMDISTDLAKLRGLEQIMWDAYDNPELLHRLLAFMRDGILSVQEQAEKAGDYSLLDHQNQAMPYARELADPGPVRGFTRGALWGYMAAQEFTAFGPEQFDEFMLQYQLPILSQYGLVAYGCCEDLTTKIEKLRQIPNLRRIAVSPFAQVERCAEQIGRDYVLSYRPNPSSMVSRGLDEDYVRAEMRKNFAVFKRHDNIFDITLKDVETVSGQFENVVRWTQIVREEIRRAF